MVLSYSSWSSPKASGDSKYCLTTKTLHLGKLLGHEQLKLPISSHDAALRAVASRIIGHTLSDLEWRQAKRPANRSDLALSDVLIIADAALISSHAAFAKILTCIQSESRADAILLQRLQKAPARKSAVTRLNVIYMAMGNDTRIIPSTSDLLKCLKQKELKLDETWKMSF